MKFLLEACCVVVNTNLVDEKIGILSLNSDKILLPALVLDEQYISNLDAVLIDFIKNFISISPLYITPQLISINYKQNTQDTVMLNYGFLIPEQVQAINTHWLEFNYANPETEYANTIAQVIQKLK